MGSGRQKRKEPGGKITSSGSDELSERVQEETGWERPGIRGGAQPADLHGAPRVSGDPERGPSRWPRVGGESPGSRPVDRGGWHWSGVLSRRGRVPCQRDEPRPRASEQNASRPRGETRCAQLNRMREEKDLRSRLRLTRGTLGRGRVLSSKWLELSYALGRFITITMYYCIIYSITLIDLCPGQVLS